MLREKMRVKGWKNRQDKVGKKEREDNANEGDLKSKYIQAEKRLRNKKNN